CTVHAQNSGEFSGRNLHGDLIYNRSLTFLDGDVVYRYHINICSFLTLTKSHRKNGPPISADKIPRGSSAGAMITRATLSARIIKIAPPKAENFTNSR